MMKLLPLDELQAGMVVGPAVLTTDGRPLLKAGTILEEKSIKALKKWGIRTVRIDVPMPGETPVEEKTEIEPKHPAEVPSETPPDVPADADGSFVIHDKKNAIMLTVTAPKGKGKKVSFEDVKKELVEKSLLYVNWEKCEQEVRFPAGVPRNVLGTGGFCQIEKTEEGVILAVFPPLAGGMEVNVNMVTKKLEAARVAVSDFAAVQKITKLHDGKPYKIAEFDGSLAVQKSKDGRKVIVRIIPPHGGRPVSVEAVLAAFQKESVAEAVSREHIEEAIKREDIVEIPVDMPAPIAEEPKREVEVKAPQGEEVAATTASLPKALEVGVTQEPETKPSSADAPKQEMPPQELPMVTDGTFEVQQKRDRILLTVNPPKGGGRKAALDEVKKELARMRLLYVDWKKCEQAVSFPLGTPKNIGTIDGFCRVELMEKGVMLTIFPPLRGGKKVSAFAASRAVQEAGVAAPDIDFFQKIVTMPTGKPLKVAEYDGTFHIGVTEDGMKALVTVVPPHGGRRVTPETIIAALKKEGIVHGENTDAIRQAVEKDQIVEITVASGMAAVDDIDARLDYKFMEAVKNHDWHPKGCRIIDEIGRVSKGDVLLEKIPLKPGTDGVTVKGAPVPRRKAQDIDMKTGKNIDVSEDGLRCMAACDGIFVASRFEVEAVSLAEVRVEAATLEAAMEGACQLMGATREAVGYEILEEGSKGLIGIGARPFKVRVYKK